MAKNGMSIFRAALLASLFNFASASLAAQEDFASWLAGVKAEAAANGIEQSVLDQALDGIQPISSVLEADRKQPEFTMSFDDYMSRVVSPARIKDGKQLYAQNRKALKPIAEREGVPIAQIVAMWGIESNYGRNIGNFQVVPALATLAYDGRRSQYFRTELMKALSMVALGVPPEHMRGSWAGAMGQCQFMPSTYLHFAQPAEVGGPADIWSKREDVWASTAHYLNGLEWKPGQAWGLAVKLPKRGMAPALFGMEQPRPLQDWVRLGVRRANGKKLGAGEIRYALIRVDGDKTGKGGEGPAYLVGDNFRALLHWNRSFFFAVAAGTLADRIASR
jgi:membrane-bound lytic murein transglycosylase B